MQISEIDKNFKIETKIDQENLTWLDCKEEVFALSGLVDYDSGMFTRLPADLLPRVRKELAHLSRHTSGARLRFRTNSDFIGLHATFPSIDLMPHMPLTGSAGFDLYAVNTFEGFLAPSKPGLPFAERLFHLRPGTDKDGFRDITINFPLYNAVSSLYIGLDKNAVIQKPKKTAYGKVVFYGSSITQGGVASRPGNNYTNILAKWLDFELVNLGFSGNALGDDIIADYIASIDMDAFVLDYDFNAPSPDHLKKTHEPIYHKIRKAQPKAKIIIISNPVPDIRPNPEESYDRFKIIEATYKKALAKGDKRVWLINGADLLGKDERDTCTVDNVHPNDLGFYRMARHIKPVLLEALKTD